ncbi:MAG TPA: IMP cyclohydrolase [Candidatus Paceibacterota bacterium]|nr:IMP cyclohydrolase [Candidatus Paceibacterota bacterium]
MDFLKNMRYPGRFIVLGEDGEYFVAIYGAMGRNSSSLRRKYEKENGGIKATQLESGGDAELLNYQAVRFLEKGIIVANGCQGDYVKAFTKNTAQEQLLDDLQNELPEPDKYNTPRITAAYFEKPSEVSAALHIVRQNQGVVERKAWRVELVSGKGMYISTYAGDDVRPAPSFLGDPLLVDISFGSADIAARSIFDLLTPPAGGEDYRVGVIACYKKFGEEAKCSILNCMEDVL